MESGDDEGDGDTNFNDGGNVCVDEAERLHGGLSAGSDGSDTSDSDGASGVGLRETGGGVGEVAGDELGEHVPVSTVRERSDVQDVLTVGGVTSLEVDALTSVDERLLVSTEDVTVGLGDPRVVGLVGTEGGTDLSACDAFAPVLAFGDSYAKEEYELKQLTRLLRHQTEFHLRDFAVPPDGSAYDLVPAHEETMKLGFDAAETALKRAKLICRPKSVALVSSHLAAAFQSYVASFVERELQKACDLLRKEASGWSTWPQRKNENGYFDDNTPVPTSLPGAPAFTTTGGPPISIMEPLFCAMRLCRWGLSSLARLSRFMQLNLAPRLAKNPELVTAWITERTRITVKADQVGAELLTYISAGITTRSLALLSFIQQGSDFIPAEARLTADLGSSGTKAALHYQHFLAFALQEAEPLLKQIHAASTAEQEIKSSAWDRQRQEAIIASRQKGDALRRILKDNKLCSGSFILSIGFGLFKGLCCHLRSYPVNDIGVLIMKKDVAIYRNAVNILFKHSTSEENLALSEMFDVLKELMNLLMVPLDNIRNVKSTGLLKEFHHKDIVEFLQMRQDIGKALSDALKV